MCSPPVSPARLQMKIVWVSMDALHAADQHSLPQLPPAEEGEEEDAAAVEARPQA